MKNHIIISLLSILPLFLLGQNNPNEWTVVTTYEIPGKAGGLTFDGTFLYSGLYSSPGDDNLIYKINPADGSYELLCEAPQEKSYGLSYDGTHFWSTDRQGSYDPALAVQFNEDGNLLSSFELPATYISGIEYMSDGTFWVCAYYDPDGTAFHIDGNGNVLDQFTTPNNQPWAICQMNDQFWIADYDADMIYLVDENGQEIESHESIGIKPTGVVYDGQYLWYVTGPSQNNSTLYKIDLGGGGNPELSIQPLEFNIGDVTVGDNESFQLDFINTGGSLGIFITEDISGTGTNLISLTNLPDEIEVEANETEIINADLDFLNPGVFDFIQLFTTNDPLHTEIEVRFFGEIAFDGPVLQTNVDEINFNDIRKFATSRRWVSLINTGNTDLTIDNITYGNSSFYSDDAISFPADISSLDTLHLGVWFYPQSLEDFSTELNITSNDPNSPTIINIEANAVETDNTIGSKLWDFQITTGYDQSPKAMLPINDISGDNVGDLIICSEDNNIRCLNGNSSGTADELWITEIYSGDVYQQNAVCNHQDIDQDSYEDFIIGTTGGDRSVICLSAKTGDIIWKYQTNEFGNGGWVYEVNSSKDYNNDGINDVLAAAGDDAYDTGPKGVILIDGSTGEKIWRAALNAPAFGVIAVTDINNDDIPDVVAGASNSDETEGRVFGINGQNGNIIWSFNTGGTSVWGLTPLGDINGDEVADVMAGDFGGNYYLLDATNGNELQNGTIGNKIILRLLELDDVNEDGYMDIAIASSSSNTYLIDGYTGNTLWSASLSDKSWNLAVSNDLNNDGINDLLAGTLYSSNFSYFLDGSNGEELSKKAAAAPIDALISIADICRDYTQEMVVGDRNGKITCYSGGLDGSVSIDEINHIQEISGFRIAPNPVSNKINILIEWPENETVLFQIVDMSTGSSLTNNRLYLNKGIQQISRHMQTLSTNLSNSAYLLRITGETTVKQEKFIYIK